MSNENATVMIPDAFQCFIDDGYDRLHIDKVTPEMRTAAFQEMVNLLAMLMAPYHGPDPDDVRYFSQMEDNTHAWGHGRIVSREAQVIGGAFLAGLKALVESPRFEDLLANTRLGDGPAP